MSKIKQIRIDKNNTIDYVCFELCVQYINNVIKNLKN